MGRRIFNFVCCRYSSKRNSPLWRLRSVFYVVYINTNKDNISLTTILLAAFHDMCCETRSQHVSRPICRYALEALMMTAAPLLSRHRVPHLRSHRTSFLRLALSYIPPILTVLTDHIPFCHPVSALQTVIFVMPPLIAVKLAISCALVGGRAFSSALERGACRRSQILVDWSVWSVGGLRPW